MMDSTFNCLSEIKLEQINVILQMSTQKLCITLNVLEK